MKKLALVAVTGLFLFTGCGTDGNNYVPPPEPKEVKSSAPDDVKKVYMDRASVEITCFEGDKLFVVGGAEGGLVVIPNDSDCAE